MNNENSRGGEKAPLLQVLNLKQDFKVAGNKTAKIVHGVSFEILPGQTYGLVGESGSGKSTIAKSIIRLNDPTDGKIYFHGKEISGRLDGETKKLLRTRMQMIFQDPMASLNPSKCIGDIVAEGLDNIHGYSDRKERQEKVSRMLERVGINPLFYGKYSYQLSGGQRQRVGIARALIMQPDLLIADECISALDVSVQAQVINLLKDLQEETGVAILFIAHDLSMVKYISDKIGVLHLGYMVEEGTAEEVFLHPVHPYTKNLIQTIPSINPVKGRQRMVSSYDYETSGLDYAKGKWTLTDGSHYVLTEDGKQF